MSLDIGRSVSAIWRMLSFAMVLICLFCAESAWAKDTVRIIARNLLAINSVSDWLIQTIFVWLAYTASYLATSSILEYTNPAPKDEARMKEIKNELRLGVVAMVFNVVYATIWMWVIEPYTSFYGYFMTNQYTVTHFIISAAVYLLFFDSWFYWTHRLLHVKFLWRHVHYAHHQFLHPTAFAQDAVHPFEAVLQGPMGHHFAAMVYPIHPVAHALFGFLTSIYAIAAHDGRAGDLNDHCKHHTHKHVNFGLYWGLWDYICGTRYQPKQTKPWAAAVKPLEDENNSSKTQ
jgi:lathosterol oxidase